MGADKCVAVLGVCVCMGVFVGICFIPLISLQLSMVDQGSIQCSIEDLYIDGLQSNNVSSLNQSRIYFTLQLRNGEDQMGVYYDNLNLSFSYNASAGHIVPIGNYSIHKFYQGADRETERKDYVVMNEGTSWQEISRNLSSSPSSSSDLVLRVDLATDVKFKELVSKAKSKKRKIMAWAEVQVDPITGKKRSRKAIKLKNTIKHHSNGGVAFAFAIVILLMVTGPCGCVVAIVWANSK